jgi:hypothetical protein
MNNKSDSQASPSARFHSLLKQVLAVPKAEIDRRQAEYKKQRKAEKQQRERASEI